MFCTPDHTQLTPKQPAGGTRMWNYTMSNQSEDYITVISKCLYLVY